MAEDLGTWPPEQATVLLEVLGEAGLTPDAKRTRDGILVTVPDDQSDQAHRQLVANMDRIARAARQPRGQAPRGARRPRPVKGADPTSTRGGSASSSGDKGVRPIGLILLGLLLLLIVGRASPIAAFVGLGVLVYLIGKRVQQQGGGSGGGPGLR
ncbi:MAG: hypothetical protein ACLFS9_04440 [Nitriliruptoraceae bacterium]